MYIIYIYDVSTCAHYIWIHFIRKHSVNHWVQWLYSSIPSCREFALCHLFRGLVPHPDPKEKFQKPTRAWRFLNGKPVTQSLGVPSVPVFHHSHCISVLGIFLSHLKSVLYLTVYCLWWHPYLSFSLQPKCLLLLIIWWINWPDLKIFRET